LSFLSVVVLVDELKASKPDSKEIANSTVHVPVTAADSVVNRIVQAFRTRGAQDGKLAAEFLKMPENHPLAEQFARALPDQRLAMLMLVAAMLRLQAWEEGGLLAYVEQSCPSSEKVRDDLMRAESECQLPHASELMQSITTIWFMNFAWNTIPNTSADVVFCAPSRKEIIDGLADFLWRLRHLARVEKKHG
jgi:hypothetical protein